MRPASSRRTPAQQHVQESLLSPAHRFLSQSFPFLSSSCPLHVAHQSRSANGNSRDLRHYSVSGNGRFRSGTDDALLLWPARSGRPRRKAYDNTHTVGLTFGSSVSSSPLLARLGRSEGKEQFCGHRKTKKQMKKCGIYFFTEKIEIEVITEDIIKRSDYV